MTCVICHNGSGEVKLRDKGVNTLLKVSVHRKDSLQSTLKSNEINFVHEKCRKSYTASSNILKAQKTENHENIQPCVLRSGDNSFNYRTHCLICATEIDFEDLQKHPNRNSAISSVEIVSSGKRSILQETLLGLCERRSDDKAADVKARIIVAGDIRAVEAIYHRHCMQCFMYEHDRTTSENSEASARNIQNTAFTTWCDLLPERMQNGKLYTVQELLHQYAGVLPSGIPPYSLKHFKRRLLQYFESRITIAEVDGRPNVVTLTDEACSILHESYHESQVDNTANEDLKAAKSIGQTVKNHLKDMAPNTDVYPQPGEIDIELLEKQVPPLLLMLMQNIFDKPRSPSACLRQRIFIVSVCHILMQASHQSFVSPLFLSTGLFIHQTTRSRVALNLLSTLGMSVSYDQVLDFEKAAVLSQQSDDMPQASQGDVSSGFCQWIADNFDYNEDTLNGHQSTHVMGIVTCQTPAHQSPVQIQRRKMSSSDLLLAGNFGNMVHPYKQPAKNGMFDVNFLELPQINISVSKFLQLDSMWLLSSLYSRSSPNWQGFMSEIASGQCICTSVTYNPMIPLNPQTNEAVYSTMRFVDSQRIKLGQCCAQLTFDQPLYAKGYKIKTDNPNEFSHVQLRLGGFHQLMSYLGAGCKCMEDSGLDELWATVYARKSLPKMFDGKSYSKILRACLLTDAALHVTLLESDKLTSANDFDDDDEVSVPEEVSIISKDTADQLNRLQQEMFKGDHDTFDTDETLNQLHVQLVELKEQKRSLSRTSKLWLMFMDFVSIVRMFVRAERTGNWQLHLKATESMLPLFAASGHNNYAKFCRLYLQDCLCLCSCLKVPMEAGLFTIRRNSKQFWSGTWSDMIIEQCLMRAGKTQGGLINITHKDSARTKWLLSAHIVAQYTDALRLMTNTSSEIVDHHRDMNPGRIKQNYADLQTFLSFLRSHNPFMAAPEHQLRNIASEVVAVDKVNVDEAFEIGTRIQLNMTGMKFGDVVLKKSSQVVTFATMKKSIRLSDGAQLRMSSMELYQRLLAMTLVNGPPSHDVFSFELAAVSPALFHDDGSMRKCQKSVLAKYLLTHYHKEEAHTTTPGIVIDGCALLQQIPWRKIGTIEDICKIYVESVIHRTTQHQPCCVVFDTYEATTTKELEQKRRKIMKVSAPDIIVKNSTPVPQDKARFMSNKQNKQALIYLLAKHLAAEGIHFEHAAEEGDADVVVVSQAIMMVESTDEVVVYADDTDILVLLIHHSKPGTNLFMKSKVQLISINQCKQGLG
ncbi:uncharacterized protein [Haliotis cracherodii]|uniref:uncharacterized protein n=1 Tax=Haliotis cracherodii TaxID=6455 RepID=UPI0039EB26F9